MSEWHQYTSKTTGKLYYFNKRTGESVYERPPDLIPDGIDGDVGPVSKAGGRAAAEPPPPAAACAAAPSAPAWTLDGELPPKSVPYGPATHGITGRGLRTARQYPPVQPRRGVNPDLYVGFDVLFQKRFMLPTAGLNLPPLDGFFPAEKAASDPVLYEVKALNVGTKSKLDTKAIGPWRNHTKLMLQTADLTGAVRRFDVEMGTKAWCKMYEILVAYRLEPAAADCTTVHLCEAPGAFITATNHCLRQLYRDELRLNWRAITLNPYYEDNDPEAMVDSDAFIIKTVNHWFFGADDMGDIRSAENIEALAAAGPKAQLVTADGSIDCSTTPNEQESVVAHLHYCEAVAALRLLALGGHFVLKMFTYFERSSLDLLYLLGCTFEEVHVCKPASSTQGNAETYVVAKWFKGELPPSLLGRLLKATNWRGAYTELPDVFSLAVIPRGFVQAFRDCAQRFSAYACDVIERNIRTEGTLTYADKEAIRELKREAKRRFLEEVAIITIPKEATLTGEALKGNRLHTGARVSRRHESNDNKAPGTLAERQAAKMARVEKLEANRKVIRKAPELTGPAAKRVRAAKPGTDGGGSAPGRTQRYGDFAAKMMAKMGYKEGEGLGKSHTGIVKPLSAKKLDHRLGLGYQTGDFADLDGKIPDGPFFETYDGPAAAAYAKFPDMNAEAWPLGGSTITCGAALHSISMTRFGLPKTMKELLTQRRLLFESGERLRRATEPLLYTADRAALAALKQQGEFMDGTGDALKLALLDALFDLCRLPAAPGSLPGGPPAAVAAAATTGFRFSMLGRRGAGFAEYVCWKFGVLAEGDYFDGADAQVMGGHGGKAKGRQVGSEEEYISAMEELGSVDPRRGVDFVVADLEPWSLGQMAELHVIESEVSRDAVQHTLLILVQLHSALRLLRVATVNDAEEGGKIAAEGGDLVVRMGDCYTRMGASIVHVLYKTFSEIRVVKPYLSSPLDPERFVVCTGFRGLPAEVDAVLTAAVAEAKTGRCVMSIVPMHLLLETTFLGCLCRTNDRLALRQLAAMQYIDMADAMVERDDSRFVSLGYEAVGRINLDQLKHMPDVLKGGASASELGGGAAPMAIERASAGKDGEA